MCYWLSSVLGTGDSKVKGEGVCPEITQSPPRETNTSTDNSSTKAFCDHIEMKDFCLGFY